MRCVVSDVFFLAWENHKVFGSVVVFVPVDVVDYLSGAKFATELLLCNNPVFVPSVEFGVSVPFARAFVLPFTLSGGFLCGGVPAAGGVLGFEVSFQLCIRALV